MLEVTISVLPKAALPKLVVCCPRSLANAVIVKVKFVSPLFVANKMLVSKYQYDDSVARE
jgi:hypothetical protein